MRFISGTRLDDRLIRTDWDAGFTEGRQYGRGRSGGQVKTGNWEETASKATLHQGLPSSGDRVVVPDRRSSEALKFILSFAISHNA